MKISKPGIDVLTAGPGNLAFSSDWSTMPVYQRGTSSIAWSHGNFNGSFSRTINWNKTFETMPMVLFFWVLSGARIPMAFGSGFSVSLDRGEFLDNPESGNSNSMFFAVGQVGLSSMTFSAFYLKASSGVVTPSMTIEYIVFDNNL